MQIWSIVFVLSPGIEPGLSIPQTDVLSIKLQEQFGINFLLGIDQFRSCYFLDILSIKLQEHYIKE